MSLTESFSALLTGIKVNPRLRRGLWLVVGIVWLYVVLLLRDEARVAQSEHQALAKKVARIELQSRQTEWTARVEPLQAVQIQLESRLWREGTVGLAQAAFQDWLNQAALLSNLTRTVISVAAQDENTPDKNATVKPESNLDSESWKVSAKVGFDFTPRGFYAFMGRLEGHDKQIIVETLIVRGPPLARAEMVLVAYFRKPVALEKK